MGEHMVEVLHPSLTRLCEVPFDTLTLSDRAMISKEAKNCYQLLVEHNLAPPQQQSGCTENIAVALLHLSGRVRSHAVKDAYSLWHNHNKRSKNTARISEWVSRLEQLQKKLCQLRDCSMERDCPMELLAPAPWQSLFKVDERGSPIGLPPGALLHDKYTQLDRQEQPRELARLAVLPHKVKSLTDLPALLAGQCPEQHGLKAVEPDQLCPSTSELIMCTSCNKGIPREDLLSMLRLRLAQVGCQYSSKWLQKLQEHPHEMSAFKCPGCIIDAAMEVGRQRRQSQLCELSTELAWTCLKAGLRMRLCVTFESGQLLLGCQQGTHRLPTTSRDGTVKFSVVVLNGTLCEQITGTSAWESFASIRHMA